MLQKVIISVVLLISVSFNVHIAVRDYLIQKEKEFYTEYLSYTVISDRNGQIMGLLQLQAVAEPIVGDTIIVFTNEKELFTKFNPEKYRGLIVGFFWNNEKSKQDGKCNCTLKCNGKGTGTGNGQCKKITISIFKSGSVIITGGRLVVQIEDAYAVINEIFKKYYNEIIKLSILDFMGPELNEKPVKSAKKTIKLNIKKVCKIHK